MFTSRDSSADGSTVWTDSLIQTCELYIWRANKADQLVLCPMFTKMDVSEDSDSKVQCKYGASCYQKNEAHLKRFKHDKKVMFYIYKVINGLNVT
jgi:PBZ domain